ncbi:MAG: tRNA delta(2)-isopentenylpyrophosphate transferase, tRNA dimethylallyltransferase [Candidatus Parcubacteria bacterium]|jgi:tRNA dimethylallyltransferase
MIEGERSNTISTPVIIIVGPTSSGKTSLAISLAKKYDGEVISADSRQVYKGLNIGTGKVTTAETEGIPHHLLDIVDAEETYTADTFVRDATRAITISAEQGKVPIIAGGTGFYIDALLGRITLGAAPADPSLRAELSKISTDALLSILQECNPKRADAIVQKHETQNRVRIIRAIEIARNTGEKSVVHASSNNPLLSPLWIGISHTREALRERINQRLRERINEGMFKEIEQLHEQGLSWERMHELGLEYRYGSQYVRGELTLDEVETILQNKIWQYARRQMTYWKRNTDIHWFPLSRQEDIDTTVRTFLEH